MTKYEEAIKEFGDEYLRYWDENDIRQMCDIGREEFAFAPRREGFDESKEFFLETDEGLVSLSEEEVDEWIKEKIAEMESRVLIPLFRSLRSSYFECSSLEFHKLCFFLFVKF